MYRKREVLYLFFLEQSTTLLRILLFLQCLAVNIPMKLKKIMSDTASGRKHSDETKKRMSDVQKKIDHSGRFKPGQQRAEELLAGKPSQQIEVTDIKNNTTISYDSISEAARALNIKQSIITLYVIRNQKKPYKGQYTFKSYNYLVTCTKIVSFRSLYTSSSSIWRLAYTPVSPNYNQGLMKV